MPKTVLIMRHAKSSWADSGMNDHDRPLNKRGLADTPTMGKLLVEKKLVPQRLLYSSAQRTTMTAELLAQQFDGQETVGGGKFSSDHKIEVDELYHAPWGTYVQTLTQLASSAGGEALSSIMLLGHNPGVEVLIEKLTGEYEVVPTATIAWLELATDNWADCENLISTGGYRLMDLWRPKEL